MPDRITLDRQLIINAAAKLLNSHGAEKLTLTLIAQEIGVTQPALYNHVAGVEDVWRGLGLMERALLTERLSAATIGLAGEDAVRAVANAWRLFAIEHSALYAIGSRYPVGGDPELEAAVDRVIGVIDSALRGFDLADEQRLHAAVALRSSLHGFCDFQLGDGNPTPLQIDDIFAHTVELFLVGLRALARGTIDELEQLTRSQSGK